MDHFSEVSEELAYYIMAEKKACLPGLGSFEVVYRSAKMNANGTSISPPYEIITFTTLRDENTSFVNYANDQLGDQEAYTKFHQIVTEKIKLSNKIELPDVGLLHKNKLGLLRLDPISNEVDKEIFQPEEILLQSITTHSNTSDNTIDNSPGAADNKRKEEKGYPLLRIGMIATICALFITIYFNNNWDTDVNVSPKAVSAANVNVSPKLSNDVFIASADPNDITETIAFDEQKEITARQDAMSDTIANDSDPFISRIVTNTFGSLENVQRQLKLIESLGYESETWIKTNGLTSTLIILEYKDEIEFEKYMEEIKEHFPRAKEY